jgi:hypothetical protein
MSRTINSDHRSPNSSNATFTGQSERRFVPPEHFILTKYQISLAFYK